MDRNESTQENNNLNYLDRFTSYAKASKSYFVLFLVVIVCYILYLSIFIPGQPSWNTIKNLFDNSPKIFASLTLMVTLSEGGGIIVFFFHLLWEEKKRKNQAAREKEKMVLIQPFLDWDRRRQAAEARSEKFTEPMPSPADFNIPVTTQNSHIENNPV